MNAAKDPAPQREWPAYAMPAGCYAAPPVHHTSHRRLLVILGVGLLVVVAVGVLVAVLATPAPPQFPCAPQCERPPIRPPVGTPGGPMARGGVASLVTPDSPTALPAPATGQSGSPPGQPAASTEQAAQPRAAQNVPRGAAVAGPPVEVFPRFAPADGGFSVAYPAENSTVRDGGVVMRFPHVDGEAVLLGKPAGDQTPDQIATGIIQKLYPGATRSYQIPNAMVGYQPGYGEVDDFYPQAQTSSYTRVRVEVIVAEKNGLALIAAADGPYEQFTPDSTDHPSGANLKIASWIGYFVNSFAWHGDPPR
jgi:hypothetical protein